MTSPEMTWRWGLTPLCLSRSREVTRGRQPKAEESTEARFLQRSGGFALEAVESQGRFLSRRATQ